MFRAECKAGTSLGQQACAILARGELVGDDLVNPIVAERTARPDCARGFLLDGYPRTVPQARFLDQLVAKRGLRRPAVIHLVVPPEEIVVRLSARRHCPACSRIYNLISQPPSIDGICDGDGAALVQRDDDNEATIRKRLRAYAELTDPVLAYYSSVWHIDGNRPPEEVALDIQQRLRRPARVNTATRA
jgi:adenylate kinase